MNFKTFKGKDHPILVNLDFVQSIEHGGDKVTLFRIREGTLFIYEPFEEVKGKIFPKSCNFGPG